MKSMLTRAAPALLVLALAPASACGSRTELFLGATGRLADASVSDDGGADAGAIACTPGTFPLVAAVPAIMLVLDRSGSMSNRFGQGGTRWETLTSALSSTLPPVDATMEIGALLFPSGNATSSALSCVVATTADLTPATNHVPALLSLLGQTSPGGGTPTYAALGVAAGVLRTIRAATTARAIVLATDGAPNCNEALDPVTCTCAAMTSGQSCTNNARECLDNVRTVASIAAYAADGLPTYVIGIQDVADTEFTQVLDAMAVAGGRPQTGAATSYYAATSGADLASALVTIRNQVGGCTFLTTSVPGSVGTITVTLDGVVLPYDPSGKTGWSWGDESNGQIVLAGTTCAAGGSGAGPALVARVGCSAADASVDSG